MVAAKHHDVVLRHLDAFRAALLWVIGRLRDRHVEAVGRLWFTKERGELSSGFCGWPWSKPLHKVAPPSLQCHTWKLRHAVGGRVSGRACDVTSQACIVSIHTLSAAPKRINYDNDIQLIQLLYKAY